MIKLISKNQIFKYLFIILIIQFLYPLFFGFFKQKNINFISDLDHTLRLKIKEKIRFILNSQSSYNTNLKIINVPELINIRNNQDLIFKKNYLRKIINLNDKNNILTYFNNDHSLKFENKNIDYVDKLIFEMKNKINSISYLITPLTRNKNLLIFHLGHDGNFNSYKKQINFFINKGYDVLLIAMPLTGQNSKPIVQFPNIGEIQLNNHDKMKFLKLKDEYSPISYFISPVNSFLKKVLSLKKYEQVNMVGISGGGWTTIVFSALNEEIDLSFSVAGGRPISLMYDTKFGDFEQTLPSFYSKLNNFDLYIMASKNDNERKFFQIINQYEECCFKYWEIYEKNIKDISSQLGGSFNIFIDKTHSSHNISSATLRFIHNQIIKE